MNDLLRLTIIFLIGYSCALSIANAQENESPSSVVTAALLESSSMTINGSSTLHDWDVAANDFTVRFRIPDSWFESRDNWTGADVDELSVTVPVDKLDGGKNKMNRDLKEALRFPEFQTIRFNWERIAFTGENDTGRRAEVDGEVTVAGETRAISFVADLSLNEESQIVASGGVDLNMKHFEIEPPTALFGVIRTDEQVDLRFELLFGLE